jgi:hypothetical protein
MGMYPVAVYYNNHKIYTNIHNTTQNYNIHKNYKQNNTK